MSAPKSPGQEVEAADAGSEMWAALRPLTAARIGLPRTGASLATPALLDFRLAHARARDAVVAVLDDQAVQSGLAQLGWQALVCRTAATDRRSYLMRPTWDASSMRTHWPC